MSLLINIGYFTIKCLMDKRKCHVIHVLRRITLKYRKTNLFYEKTKLIRVYIKKFNPVSVGESFERGRMQIVACKILQKSSTWYENSGLRLANDGAFTLLFRKNDSAGKTEIKFLVLPEFW